ncbi:unnamed protein product [Cuscuta campestris]|uniref:Uncharacterized protein n=1 Tax=Cuscuta campestris TaxID=132261 RepID=A0A484LGE9_9ASTE|nr:unnamed protein product [Cuscuta campestris]
MEESEKRRERLKAMRMEADCVRGEAENSNMGVSSGHGLANPLLSENQTSQQGVADLRPRFDYYTDPMAAYSADKRRNNHIPQVVSQPHFTPRPASSNVTGYPSQGSYFEHDQRPPQAHRPPFRPPMGSSPVHDRLPGSPQNAWVSPGGPPSNNYPPNSTRFSNSPNHRYGQGGHGFGYGRGGPMFSNSPRPISVPGGSSSSPYQYQGSGRGGRGGGRWQGNNVDNQRENRYYNRSMIEDPWARLQPTIWKKKVNANPNSSWMPNSISSVKKARVSEGPAVKIPPQQSLAEYLAASFGEAVNDDAVKNAEIL